MKLLILSDLHNEISPFQSIKTDADAVVLAGDIDSGDEGLRWAAHAFEGKPVIYIPGNHEFYQNHRLNTLDALRTESARIGDGVEGKVSRVHVLDNDETIIDGVRFLGCTLWTDFNLFGEADRPYALREGEVCLNDFRLIKEGVRRVFTPQDSITLHENSLCWLAAKLDERFNGVTVVVTHHLPSMLSVSDRFKKSQLSACFASNLDHLFGKMDLWVHGHTHDNIDYFSNGTRVICNPRGYVRYHGVENIDFDPTLIIEI